MTTTTDTTTQSCFQRYATAGERKVTRKLVKAILERGYTVSVYDGEEWTVKGATKLNTVLDALATTGEDLIRARDADGNRIAAFSLIWGNDESGEEVIADHTATEEAEALYDLAHA